MKWIGLVFVLIGMLWSSFNSVMSAPIARAVTSDYYEKIQIIRTAELNAEKVRMLVADSVYEYYKRLPNNMAPATLMFLGGLILFRESVRLSVRAAKE